MEEFAILNSRKRAWIALIHSIVFFAIALHGFASPKPGVIASGPSAAGDLALIAIYTTVASILVWLTVISRCARERLYFGLCASSATFGLLRTIFGDGTLPAAQYLRVTMLASAVTLGLLIVRSFARVLAEAPSE